MSDSRKKGIFAAALLVALTLAALPLLSRTDAKARMPGTSAVAQTTEDHPPPAYPAEALTARETPTEQINRIVEQSADLKPFPPAPRPDDKQAEENDEEWKLLTDCGNDMPHYFAAKPTAITSKCLLKCKAFNPKCLYLYPGDRSALEFIVKHYVDAINQLYTVYGYAQSLDLEQLYRQGKLIKIDRSLDPELYDKGIQLADQRFRATYKRPPDDSREWKRLTATTLSYEFQKQGRYTECSIRNHGTEAYIAERSSLGTLCQVMGSGAKEFLEVEFAHDVTDFFMMRQCITSQEGAEIMARILDMISAHVTGIAHTTAAEDR